MVAALAKTGSRMQRSYAAIGGNPGGKELDVTLTEGFSHVGSRRCNWRENWVESSGTVTSELTERRSNLRGVAAKTSPVFSRLPYLPRYLST